MRHIPSQIVYKANIQVYNTYMYMVYNKIFSSTYNWIQVRWWFLRSFINWLSTVMYICMYIHMNPNISWMFSEHLALRFILHVLPFQKVTIFYLLILIFILCSLRSLSDSKKLAWLRFYLTVNMCVYILYTCIKTQKKKRSTKQYIPHLKRYLAEIMRMFQIYIYLCV